MKRYLLPILFGFILFSAGVVVGTVISSGTDTDRMYVPAVAQQSTADHQPTITIKSIVFADEEKRDFIKKHAQFAISPTGEITDLRGRDAVLIVQHDKEDWDWYNATFTTDPKIIEKYRVPYGKHRKHGLPGESIFDPSWGPIQIKITSDD